jgi:hypothetical protein
MAISFHQQVAPIFAWHCNECHGDAGGLNLRTYTGILEGGNKGKILIAGDPGNSLLIHFVEGRRGPAQRMPPSGPPLSDAQLRILRQWIAEGAREDVKIPPPTRILPSVTLPARIALRVPARAYVTLSALHPSTGEILWSESAALQTAGVRNWDLRPATGWPPAVQIKVAVDYCTATLEQVELTAGPLAR